MHGLLLLLSPFFIVLSAVTLVACVRGAAHDALAASAALAVVAGGVTFLIGWTEDEDPSFPGQSRWAAHEASHAAFEVLIGLLVVVVLALILSREWAASKWLAPPALFLSAGACFWLFGNLSH